MRRGAGRSFAALVVLGGIVEFGGTAVAVLGLDTLARCYVAGFTDLRTSKPAVCMEAAAAVGFHLFVPVALLVAILSSSTVLGTLQAVRSLGDAKRLDRLLGPRVLTLPADLTNAVQEAGASEIEVRESVEPYGVCLGILRPRVVVSTALLGVLTHDELVAVIAHEERHRRRWSPMRRLVARTATRALFYLPVLSDLSAAHVIEEEIVADEESCVVVGAHVLVRALTKLSSARPPEQVTALAFRRFLDAVLPASSDPGGKGRATRPTTARCCRQRVDAVLARSPRRVDATCRDPLKAKGTALGLHNPH